jgi:hypothetical protein
VLATGYPFPALGFRFRRHLDAFSFKVCPRVWLLRIGDAAHLAHVLRMRASEPPQSRNHEQRPAYNETKSQKKLPENYPHIRFEHPHLSISVSISRGSFSIGGIVREILARTWINAMRRRFALVIARPPS